MALGTDSKPAGNGQQGAGAPNGATKEIPVHLDDKPVNKIEEIANHAARKGIEREHREDPTVFTK